MKQLSNLPYKTTPSKAEVTGEVEFYPAKGAQEVWAVYEDGRITTFSHIGEIEQSSLAPDAQEL